MTPPELFTQQENKELAQMIEVDIDFATERKRAHEIMIADFYDEEDNNV